VIRAPKSAAIELDTMNGPISLYDVDGKLTARANNCPISLKNFSGDAEITAVNGPISVDGSKGSVRIRTENGTDFRGAGRDNVERRGTHG